MKKLLMLMLVMAMVMAMTACGGGNSTPPAEEETTPPAVEEPSGIGLNYTESINYAGFGIKYDEENGMFTAAPKGYNFIFRDDAVVFTACEYEDIAEGWDEVIENSKRELFDYLDGRAEFTLAEYIEQTVESKTEVTINGIDWLKVTGTFKNTLEGKECEVEYVTYYTTYETPTADGSGTCEIPFYVVGMPQTTPDSDTLEAFVDDFVAQITVTGEF